METECNVVAKVDVHSAKRGGVMISITKERRWQEFVGADDDNDDYEHQQSKQM